MGSNPFKIVISLLTLLILGMVVAFSVGFSKPQPPQVIISSDDAGMCSAVNEGTIFALESGLVKSVSIMACCPAFHEFARFAAAHPEYDYGVHLTLTCDLPVQPWGPVLPKSRVPSLVTSNGSFPSWPQDVAKSADIKEVEAELRAQIQKTLNAGIRVSHLDHHMFVLFARPDLLDLYVRLAGEFNLPIRFAYATPLPLLEPYGREVVEVYGSQLKKLEQLKMPILDGIEYHNYMEEASKKRAYHMETFRNFKAGTLEIVIHCSRKSDSGINPPQVDGRVADMRFFSSKEAVAELKKLQTKVIGWDVFRQTYHGTTR